MATPCLFCDRLGHLTELPADDLVWQFPHSVALLGPWQYYTGYCVLASRAHYAELHQFPASVRSAFLEEMVTLSHAIANAFSPRKLNCESLGNQVPHLHWHLFPRRADDPDMLKPVWLALDRAERDPRERQRSASRPVSPRGDRPAVACRPSATSGPDPMTSLRIGTRGSPLALWQAHHVADLLRTADPGVQIELIEIETVGDQVRDVPLTQLGGDGAFTKAIQQALLDNRVDVAVHSLKDLPTFAVEGLVLAAVPKRGPSGDALVSLKYRSFADLPTGATVATSSVRRKAQLLHRRPDLKLIDIRGNVDTRLRKLAEQNLDATILAQAGLVRLGLADRITEILDPAWMFPAVGQGALGLECRAADFAVRTLLDQLNDAATRWSVLAERAMLRGLGGGCQVPIGALTRIVDGELTLRGVVLSPDGSQRIAADIAGPMEQAESIGIALANELRRRGAAEFLQES